jgi:hypothetical protein
MNGKSLSMESNYGVIGFAVPRGAGSMTGRPGFLAPPHRRAFGGGELIGATMSRFIYLDEAGISQHEPVTVVAGIVVNADKDWDTLSAAIHALRERVPEHIREGFIFSAKEIFGGGKIVKREEWPQDQRWALLEDLVSIPRLHMTPIAIGFGRRGDGYVQHSNSIDAVKAARLEHIMAFGDCVLAAAHFMQAHAKGEIATIVAENNNEMRAILRRVPKIIRECEADSWVRGADITSIKDVPHFCEKDEAILLQLADACAFVTRRYLSEQSNAARFVKAMLGIDEHDLDPKIAAGRRLYAWHSVTRYLLPY